MKPQYIIDDKGNRTGVILPINDYNKLVDELDELQTIRLYDKAKREKLTFRPFNDVLKEIKTKREKDRVPNSD